jgi:hypothetical protein
MRRVVLVCLALAMVACTGPQTSSPDSPGTPSPRSPSATGGDLIPVLVSSEVAVGENRLLFTLIDGQNRVLSAPDVPVDLRFEPPDVGDCTPQDAAASFLAAGEAAGLYRANVTFDCAGDWAVDMDAHFPDGDRAARVTFSVREAWSAPAIGEAAPSTETPTAETPEEIASISTDDDPDPDFYRTSESDALAARQPFVLVFATPAFCRTRACGPTLDLVKASAADYKDRITFIHVEPYEMELRDGVLQPALTEDGELQSVEAVVEWGLLSEPFVFAVGSDGLVAARFEGIAAEEELTEAFEAIAGG